MKLEALTGCEYELGGAAGPLFPPHHSTAAEAREELQHLVQRDPQAMGYDFTRWTLDKLRTGCPWLAGVSLGGVHHILDNLDVVWKRARASIRSPDLNYEAKRADVARVLELARAEPNIVATFLDEITVERQPTLANAYAPRGPEQPRAQLAHAANTKIRVVATLDAVTAKVVSRVASKISLSVLVKFYQDLTEAYPDADCIYVIQDNWPIHTHPDVLVALEPQTTRWEWHRPGNWPTTPSSKAIKRWGHLNLPIQIVPLPTYASWCNPIEKLWRKLRQDVTHLHRWASDLPSLRAAITRFLLQYDSGSADLLRYVGLYID